MNVGLKVSVNSDPKIVRALWNSTGRITQTRRDIETNWNGNQVTLDEERFFVEFDEPQKAIGTTMTGLWVRENQISKIGR